MNEKEKEKIILQDDICRHSASGLLEPLQPMVAPQPRGGEISNFRHLLGLDSGQQTKPRTMKDSKEIMKKRRERAICIVSTVQYSAVQYSAILVHFNNI